MACGMDRHAARVWLWRMAAEGAPERPLSVGVVVDVLGAVHLYEIRYGASTVYSRRDRPGPQAQSAEGAGQLNGLARAGRGNPRTRTPLTHPARTSKRTAQLYVYRVGRVSGTFFFSPHFVARCVNISDICVTLGSKRSDGPERRPLEGAPNAAPAAMPPAH